MVVEAKDDYRAVFAWAELDSSFMDKAVYVVTKRDGKPAVGQGWSISVGGARGEEGRKVGSASGGAENPASELMRYGVAGSTGCGDRVRGGNEGGGENQAGRKRRVGALWMRARHRGALSHRAGAERSWSLCAPSATKLERTAAVVMTVITVMTVIMGIPPFDRKEEGRTEERSCPEKPTRNGPHSGEGKSRPAKSFGMKWNETAFWKVCKPLKTWWPGTESNRRRQPFQGCYPR